MTVQKFWDATDAITVASTYQAILGVSPAEANMDALLAFVDGQQAAYAAQGLNAVLGGYEAMGNGLADSVTGSTNSDFAFRHAQAGASTGAAADVIFVEGMFFDLYDGGITQPVRDHYLAQLNYFQAQYAGVFADANLHARAVVAAQMLGQAHLNNITASDQYFAAVLFTQDALDSNGTQVGFSTNIETYYGVV